MTKGELHRIDLDLELLTTDYWFTQWVETMIERMYAWLQVWPVG